MIETRLVGPLRLHHPPAPGRPAHLSAASGMVAVDDRFYVIADDEHHLGVFPTRGALIGDLVRLFPDDLPDTHRARKARKPDLEVLLRLPSFEGHPCGALLALASGSRPNRRTGALIPLDARGGIAATPRLIDLAGVYAGLEGELPELNIEGALVDGDRLLLLQRGSKRDRRNTVIELPLAPLLASLANADSLGQTGPTALYHHALGAIDGVPLSFTDATALDGGGFVFTAVAEDAEDSYRDGPCAGAAVGMVAHDGRLAFVKRLDTRVKVEGVHARRVGRTLRLLLVTDADDSDIAANLLAAELQT